MLVIIDYISKWAEVVPLKDNKACDMVVFIKHHIIYHFDVSRWIVHDNGPQFISQAIAYVRSSRFRSSHPWLIVLLQMV